MAGRSQPARGGRQAPVPKGRADSWDCQVAGRSQPARGGRQVPVPKGGADSWDCQVAGRSQPARGGRQVLVCKGRQERPGIARWQAGVSLQGEAGRCLSARVGRRGLQGGGTQVSDRSETQRHLTSSELRAAAGASVIPCGHHSVVAIPWETRAATIQIIRALTCTRRPLPARGQPAQPPRGPSGRAPQHPSA